MASKCLTKLNNSIMESFLKQHNVKIKCGGHFFRSYLHYNTVSDQSDCFISIDQLDTLSAALDT